MRLVTLMADVGDIPLQTAGDKLPFNVVQSGL
jgi:hypothetical protein